MNKLLAASLSLVLAAPAGALEWQNLGPRALGMGGAGVAMGQGPLSGYWNPATLGMRGNTSGFQVPVHAHAALTGDVIEGANDLEQIAKNPAAYTTTDVTRALNKINQTGSGLRVDAAVAPALKIKKIGAFAIGSAHMGAVPFADFTVTNPANLQVQNNSKLTLKGIQLMEFGGGYGDELPFAPGLLVGGNLKIMQGRVGYTDYFVTRADAEMGDLYRRFKDGAKTSTNFGVDLGALWDVERTFEQVPMRPRLGLVGRNLNNPKFSQPSAGAAAGLGMFAVNPQARLGAAFSPFNWWHIATDLDLTRNLTPVDGRPSRQFSLGTEFNVFNRSWINVPLRAGLLRNIADASNTQFTLGSGVNLARFVVDASVAWSPKKIRTQSEGKNESFPAEAAFGLSLAVLFGGGEEGARDDAPSKASPAEEIPSPQSREWKMAPPPAAQDQPAPSQQVKDAAEKAHESLDAESKKTR